MVRVGILQTVVWYAHVPSPECLFSALSTSVESVKSLFSVTFLPGILALALLRAFFADKPLRVWRALPVALCLLPVVLACWAVEEGPGRCRTACRVPKSPTRLFSQLM
jgi:hypothetical protein